MSRWFRTDARRATPARPGAPRTMTLIRCLFLMGASCLAAPAVAAPPIYRIIFQRTGFGAQYNVQQSTPHQHSGSYAVPDGSNAVFTGSAFAFPGQVGVDNDLDLVWQGGPSTSSVYEARANAVTSDFVISGPGAWVEGQLHLRARGSLSRSGSGQAARLNVDARARAGALIGMGDLYWNNTGTYGTGLFAGLTSPDLDFPFVLSGLFPVETPFDVSLQVFGLENVSGTGWGRTNTGLGGPGGGPGLFLEEVGGQVLTLPAGYTLNSATWNIVNNTLGAPLGIARPDAPSGLSLAIEGPNPSSGDARLSLALPSAGVTRVVVFDPSGRQIRLLADGWREAGRSQVSWDGRTDRGSVAGTGLYFVRVEAGDRIASQRIVRLR